MTDDERTVIEIADLREPQRGPEEQAVYDYGLTLQVSLDPDELLATARERAGLTDLGARGDGLVERLRLQCTAIEADAGLSGIGRLIQRRRLLGALTARLRFEDYLRRYPEALEVTLEPPVIVVGLPRSGTTHLVNLLASDARFRSMPWWEVQEPTPFPGDGPGPHGVDPRFQRAEQAHQLETAAAPLTAAMHDRPPWSIEEDCELMDLDICSYSVEWHARVPGWRDAYLAFDYEAHLAFFRTELQVLSHLRGPNRWVLKTPQHLEWIGPLLHTFPDATIAFTLRDPVAVLQSAITMLAYGDRMRRVEVGADELAAYWVDRIERLLRVAVRDRDLIDPARRVEVEFGSFMDDELGTVERILHAAGMELDDTARREIGAYLAGNPRGKNGRVLYDLRRDFHLEPADLYERWAFYFDAFPEIRQEVD